MSHTLLLLLVAACAAAAAAASSSDDGDAPRTLTYTIEHAYGADAEYSPRGTVKLKTASSSQGSLEQRLTEADAAALKAASDLGQDYCVRATSESSDGQKVSVFTCVPACTVYQAGFVDTIKLALGASGHVQGVEETTAVRTCKPGKVTKAQSFKTTVVIRRPSKGPQPNAEALAAVVREQLKAREASRPGGAEQAESPSWTRYMYMFAIVMGVQVLINAFTGGGRQAPGGGAAGGGGAGGGGGGGAAGAN